MVRGAWKSLTSSPQYDREILAALPAAAGGPRRRGKEFGVIHSLVPVLVRVAAWLIVLAGVGGASLALVRGTPRPLRAAVVLAAGWHLALLAVVGSLGYGFFHVDDPVQYHLSANSMAHLWSRGVFPNPYKDFAITSFGYYYWVSAFYLALGAHPLVPQLVNVLLALLVGVVTYRLAKEFSASDRTALWVAVAVLFYPTLAIWSVMLLKDILGVLLLLLSVEMLLIDSRRPAWWRWVAVIVMGFVASTLRFYVGILILGLGLGALVLLPSRPRKGAVVAALLAVAAIWASFSVGEGPWYVQAVVDRQARTDVSEALAAGGSTLEAPPTAAPLPATPAPVQGSLQPPARAVQNGESSKAERGTAGDAVPLAVWRGDELSGWAWGPRASVSTDGSVLLLRSHGSDAIVESPDLSRLSGRVAGERTRVLVIEMRVNAATCHHGQVTWRTTRGDFTASFPVEPSPGMRRFVAVAPQAEASARLTSLRVNPLACSGQAAIGSLSIGGSVPDGPLAHWSGEALATWKWGPQARVTPAGPKALRVRSTGNDPAAVSPPLTDVPDLVGSEGRARIVAIDMQVDDAACRRGRVIWRTTHGEFTQSFVTRPGRRRYLVLGPVGAGTPTVTSVRIDPLLCPGSVILRGISLGGLIPETPLVEWSGDTMAGWAWGPQARTANAGRTLAVRSAGGDPVGLSPNLGQVPALAGAGERARIAVVDMRVEDAACRRGQLIWRTTRGDFTRYFDTRAGEQQSVILAPAAVGAARVTALRVDPLVCPGQLVLNGLSIGGFPTPGWMSYQYMGTTRGPGTGYVSLHENIVWRVVRFFLVPLPSQHGTALVRIGKLEWLIWWPLPLLALLGVAGMARHSWQRAALAVGAMVPPVLFYAYFVGNAGTILRYRSMMFPLFACLGALGIEAIAAGVSTRRRRHSAPAP
jgi:hypothetical protein